MAIIWSIVGLASLANVAIRAAHTAPGPLGVLQGDRPDLAIPTPTFPE